MARCEQRELALLTADGLAQLLVRLTVGMQASFRLRQVQLALVDPYGVIRVSRKERYGRRGKTGVHDSGRCFQQHPRLLVLHTGLIKRGIEEPKDFITMSGTAHHGPKKRIFRCRSRFHVVRLLQCDMA